MNRIQTDLTNFVLTVFILVLVIGLGGCIRKVERAVYQSKNETTKIGVKYAKN